MAFNLKDYKNNLLFIPIGGSNEIGINVNLYHIDGKFIMVDCGAGFADSDLPGVDMIVADMSFIEQNKKNLLALVLTHAHEDHLGAVQYLWNNLDCPIYATTFTANFLKLRLADYGMTKKVQINQLKPGAKIDLAPFSIEMVPLSHSAPEMQALMIRTQQGNILHTGDWKFDPQPIIGEANDEEVLSKLGDEGILALTCDSTNIFNQKTSGSEGDLRKSLVDIIAGCPKMVVATTFASNLARLDTLIHAGQKAGRKVILTGRSLHRILAAAQESGYLNDILPLIDEREFNRYKREELLVIATGCQGEPMAAAAKMANNVHQWVKLAPKDTVIFSSKIIPGNDKKIFKMFNIFVKSGIEVITERDHFVHVSGHPGVEDLKRMYDLTRPKICIPVHGEPVHIHEHAKFARKSGIKHAVEVENGSVVLLDEHSPKIVGKIPVGYLAVDGNYLVPTESPVFKMRKRLAESGIVVVSVFVDKNNRIISKPVISMPGLLDYHDDAQFIDEIKNEIGKVLQTQNMNNRGSITREQIETLIKSNMRRILKTEMNKSPITIVNIEQMKG